MSVVEKIKHELREVAVTTLYFLVGFGIILLLFKLFLIDYDIEFTALSKAIVGALIAGKVVVLLKGRGFMNRFVHRAGYLNVTYKTLIYVAGTVVVLLLERMFEAYRETGSLAAAIEHIVQGRDLSHSGGVLMLIAVLFVFYNSMELLGQRLGESNLRAAFLGERPPVEPQD